MDKQNSSLIFSDFPTDRWFIIRNGLINRYMLHIAAFHKLQQSKNPASSPETSEINDQEILANFPHLKKHWIIVLCYAHDIGPKERSSGNYDYLLVELQRAMIQDRDSSWDGRKDDISYPGKREEKAKISANLHLEALNFVWEIPNDDKNTNPNIPEHLSPVYADAQELYSLFFEARLGFDENVSIIKSTLEDITRDYPAWLDRFSESCEEPRRKKTGMRSSTLH